MRIRTLKRAPSVKAANLRSGMITAEGVILQTWNEADGAFGFRTLGGHFRMPRHMEIPVYGKVPATVLALLRDKLSRMPV